MASIEVNTKNVLWAIGAFAAIVATTAGAVWAIRIDRLEQLKHENEIIKESKDWKLPETLNSLNELSKKVTLQIEEREKLNALTSERESLIKSNNELQAEISKLKDANAQLDVALKQSILATQYFEVARGESADLIKNAVAVGVETVYSDSAEININNDHHRLKITNTVEFPYANQTCVLQLRGIKSAVDKCAFSFGCKSK